MDTKQYAASKDFRRNELIWVLSTVDHLKPEDISKKLDVPVDLIEPIIKQHQEFWDLTA